MSELDFVAEDVKSLLRESRADRRAWKEENLEAFSGYSSYALRLIFREKEIILFALLQWAAIGMAYYIWVQMLGWIPDEVWQSEAALYDVALNVVFTLWSFACVALAAYPISVLTGAMGAAHFLRRRGYPSTIASCLSLALPNSWKLWVFHTIDGWFTVDMILERLPKRGYFRNAGKRAFKELLYYAWKVGTIGVPAALLSGKGLVDAGKDSVSLVRSRLVDVLRLRGGYSVMCWFVGISAYIGSILFFIRMNGLFQSDHEIFTFYFWMGVPILIAVGLVKLFLRPIYVIASAKLYSDFLDERGERVEIKNLPGRGMSAFVAFMALAMIMLAVFLYREEIGLMDILHVSSSFGAGG